MRATVFFTYYRYKNISIQSKRLWNKKYPVSLENISGDFSANNIKQIRLNVCVRFFC